MKKIILASLLLVPCVSFAGEHPQNPDRFPSIGLTLEGESGTGTYKTLGVSQDLTGASNALVLDTRLPLSNSFTLSLALGGAAVTSKGDANAFFSESKTDSTIGSFSISGRYYFNH